MLFTILFLVLTILILTQSETSLYYAFYGFSLWYSKMIPALLLQFNAIKAVLNATLTLMLYKPISNILKKSGFRTGEAKILGEDDIKNIKRRSILVWIIGGVIAIVAFCIIFFVLGGKIAFN